MDYHQFSTVVAVVLFGVFMRTPQRTMVSLGVGISAIVLLIFPNMSPITWGLLGIFWGGYMIIVALYRYHP